MLDQWVLYFFTAASSLYTDRETIFGSNLILRWRLPLCGARGLCSGPGPSVGGHPVFPGSCEGSSNDRTGSSACGPRQPGTRLMRTQPPFWLCSMVVSVLCAFTRQLHGFLPRLQARPPTWAALLCLLMPSYWFWSFAYFACSIGYIHDGRQAGAEQASPHNNIVMSCLFNAGKKILGGFAIWKLIFSLVSSLIILATLRPCQIMPLTVRSYIR